MEEEVDVTQKGYEKKPTAPKMKVCNECFGLWIFQLQRHVLSQA